MIQVIKKDRAESEIYVELEELCSIPGFIHVIAFFCFKDTFLHTTKDGLTSEIISQQYDRSRLSRTEISALIGLTCKHGLTLQELSKDKINDLSKKTWSLLGELHNSFFTSRDISEITDSQDHTELSHGLFMREAIFYSGEGLYKHQYRDISQYRYRSDRQWIHDNKGFDLSDIPIVIEAIEKIQVDKINYMVNEAKSLILENYLPMFEFTIDELVECSGLESTKVLSVVRSFSSEPEEGMESFATVDDFNNKNAFPILKLDETKYVSFQAFSLWESQYESPFFWFNSDKSYKAKASENRGAFTEHFTADRLSSVFLKENVITNIDIFDGKNKAAEIDVLITHGDTAIIVQAKSKKLTVAARKGNSKKLEEDFKKAIQDAYDQAYICAELLEKDSVTLKNSDGVEIKLKNKFNTIHPFCVVSDFYPALSVQARQFLKYNTTEKIKHPYVMDVFLIDLLAEMLESPLYFLDYIRKRSDFGESIISHHELVILATYLKQNLYFEDKPDLIMLAEDISADLELAMLARREGHDVPATPKGILTLYEGTYIGNIISDIKHSEDIGLMNLGYYFLSLSGETIDMLNDAIDQMVMLYKEDKKHHDISVPLLEEKTGLTIHCNDNDGELAYKTLSTHCEKRKYSVKADTWFGVCISPTTKLFRFSTFHSLTWKQSDEMDALIRDLPKITNKNKIKDGKVDFYKMRPPQRKKKIGRNDPCPCGSGKKYKKCCLK